VQLPPIVPFYGPHQGGIATRQQAHTYFATFDLTAESRADLRALLQRWTDAAANLCAGTPADATDSDEALGMPPAHLTVTFGFGPGLFVKDDKDRYGLASKRPAALVDLPVFVGDQLQPGRCGGDLSVQACADDPQTAFHAVRQLARLAYGTAQLRWAQSGFVPALVGQTPRNLMGFKDGSNNPDAGNEADMASVVWAGDEGPAWMRGGSYVVPRRIRIALEHWDRTPVSFQEQTIGRRKGSGAPVGGNVEKDLPNLAANDADGNPVIAENAHVRLASASASGARILRRGYSYNDGLSFTAERWPPWRQGMEYDSGLLFVAYQKDPRTGFIKMFDRMAKFDMMNQFVTHTGSGIFACPPGVEKGDLIGSGLFV
jgi:deferrochelatase/peroxidase EfeB